jgi:hypothetical protein
MGKVMSINNYSVVNQQEKVDPQIEEEILELLEGDVKETALGFVAYLKANHMTPRQWFGPYYWRIPYEQFYLCSLFIEKDRWRVFFFTGDYAGELEEDLVKTIQDKVMPCVSCEGDDCPKETTMTIFGKEFANACFQFPIQFANPDAHTLEHIKVLLEYWKAAAPHSHSWHAH